MRSASVRDVRSSRVPINRRSGPRPVRAAPTSATKARVRIRIMAFITSQKPQIVREIGPSIGFDPDHPKEFANALTAMNLRAFHKRLDGDKVYLYYTTSSSRRQIKCLTQSRGDKATTLNLIGKHTHTTVGNRPTPNATCPQARIHPHYAWVWELLSPTSHVIKRQPNAKWRQDGPQKKSYSFVIPVTWALVVC